MKINRPSWVSWKKYKWLVEKKFLTANIFMKQLISDESKFEKLTENPTKSREDSLITYLRKLKRDGVINDES